jgi:VCBS repeat protein
VVCVKNLVGELVWFRNSGTPRDGKPWKKYVLATKFMRSYDVVVADFDGDGKPDVAASAWIGNQFAWFRNPGKPLEDKPWERLVIDEKTAGETRTVRIADFNRDGKPDLLATITGGNQTVWYENPGMPGKAWKKHVIDEKGMRPTHGHAVDFDGDGDLDVVMALGFNSAAEGEVVWYENVGKPGDGTKWTKHVLGKLQGAFEAVAADLDGDGKLDVVATAWGPEEVGRIVWFQNPVKAEGDWKLHPLKTKWARANQVLVADLDGDKRLDVVSCAERGANEVRWWRNLGR